MAKEMVTLTPKHQGGAVQYHQVGAPGVVRRRCGAVADAIARLGDKAASPRSLALLVATLYCGMWLEMRTRVGLYGFKFVYNRVSAWWYGNPKCPPRDVAHHDYAFPPVHWEGDGPFWERMPCSPHSYQVIIPEGMRAAGHVVDGVGCDDATIVTAFFDLGRSSWGGVFARGLDAYFGESRKVMFTLKNRQVWFTQPQFVDIILEERRSLGLENRTIIIAMDHNCIPTAHLYNRTAEAMCAPGYLDYALGTTNPEQLYPWYNIIMWAKSRFIEAATHMNLVAAPYYIWLDAGCHYPVCREGDHKHMCLRPWEGTNSSRLRMASPEPLIPDMVAMTDWQFIKLRRMIVSGTIFGGGADAIRRGAAAFMATAESLLAQGIPDMDQPVWGLLLRQRRDGDLLEPYYTAYEWLPVLDWFSSPPAGDMSPFRLEPGHWKIPR